MSTFDLFITAVGLAMDAFAVSICQGLSMNRIDLRKAFIVALFMGGFQGMMPVFGYFLGVQFEHYITSIDHWIAFVLLGFLGLRMIKESGEACPAPNPNLDFKNLTLLAVATSIDALAAGVSFAFLQIQILPAVVFISLVTFAFCFVGVSLGHRFGEVIHSKAQLVGGIILIAMGTKILLSHLGFL